MRMFQIAAYTARELVVKVTILILAGISTLILLFVLAGISSASGPEGKVILFFGQPSPPLTDEALLSFIRGFEATLTAGLFTGIILFGVIATAGLIPETLEKGVVDIFLSKPLSRAEVLAGRTLGAASVILLNILYFLVGLWLIFGVRTGVWDTRFLAVPLGMIFGFLCLYSTVVVLGVVSRNTAIAVIGAFLYQFILVHILQNREAVLYPASSTEGVRRLFDALYYAFPQTAAVQEAVMRFITEGSLDGRSLLPALCSTAAWYAAGWWVLQRSDF